jgi:hypothetical protein
MAEVAHDAIALRRCRVDRHQIVVVEVDAPGAELGEAVYRRHRIERRPNEVTKWIAAAVTDRPEAERELVVGCGRMRHVLHRRFRDIASMRTARCPMDFRDHCGSANA